MSHPNAKPQARCHTTNNINRQRNGPPLMRHYTGVSAKGVAREAPPLQHYATNAEAVADSYFQLGGSWRARL